MRENWYDQAACRGMDVELFFAEDAARSSAALLTCRTCPVREPCLRTAMAEQELYGVWGGTPETYRRRIFRREARARRREERAA